MANKVGTKGQVVIDKAIRDQLGIKPGALAIQTVVDDHVEIFFLQEHDRSLFGALKPYIKPGVGIPGDADWGEIREMAWGARARDRVAHWGESERDERPADLQRVAEERAPYGRDPD